MKDYFAIALGMTCVAIFASLLAFSQAREAKEMQSELEATRQMLDDQRVENSKMRTKLNEALSRLTKEAAKPEARDAT